MDYLNHWVIFLATLVAIVILVDEIHFRIVRRRTHLANLRRAARLAQDELPEYIDEDELCVINNDTDEVVFEGSPPEVYDWILVYRGASSYDVYNRGTVKTVPAAQFLAKFIE